MASCDDWTMVFSVCVGVVHILGLTSVVLVGVWMGKFQGGFAWDGSLRQFNYHPLCMVVAFVFLYSQAMVIYRMFRQTEKMTVKVVHFILQLVAFCIAVCGLVAVFGFHNAQEIPNMYSLHSWIGMATTVLFAFQLAAGFYSFLSPKLPDDSRAYYLRFHVFFGVLMFVLVVATCLTGITEKVLFSIMGIYPTFVTEGVLVNILGLVLILLAVAVCYVVSNPAYKNKQPDDGYMELKECERSCR